MIDRPPQVMCLAVDADTHLIKMPTPVRPVAPAYPPPPDLAGKQRAEAIPPIPYRLMADVDTALEQQILDLSQRQWVADIHHHREADDFGRTVEVAEGISHLAKLWMPHLRINPFLSDNAMPPPSTVIKNVAAGCFME